MDMTHSFELQTKIEFNVNKITTEFAFFGEQKKHSIGKGDSLSLISLGCNKLVSSYKRYLIFQRKRKTLQQLLFMKI